MHKGKGDPCARDSFRASLVSTTPAKVAHSIQRRAAGPAFYACVRPGFHGGVKRSGTDSAPHKL
eukprot:11007008-Lingulodinium_polyedra.AAC.1